MNSSNNNNNDGNKKVPQQQQELPFIIKEQSGQGSFAITSGRARGWKAVLLNHLQVLREANYTQKLHITLDFMKTQSSCDMTEEIAQSLEDTFLHYSLLYKDTMEESTAWSISMEIVCKDCPCCHKVLQAICTRELFESLHIILWNGDATHKMSFALRNAMINNKGIKKLQVERMGLCEETAFVLSDGLKKTSSLEELTIQGDNTDPYGWELFDGSDSYRGYTHLVEALAENETLENFELSQTHLPDSILALIVGALIGHPTLYMLRVDENRCGELTINNLQHLLVYSGNLVCLCFTRAPWLDGIDLHGKLGTNMDALLLGLEANNSIERLTLSGYCLDDSDLIKLFDCLSKCPVVENLDISFCGISVDLSTICSLLDKCLQLEDVNLSYNEMSKLGSCSSASHLMRSAQLRAGKLEVKDSKLRFLRLNSNPLMEKYENRKQDHYWGPLVHVLQVHPFLRSFGYLHQDVIFPSQIVNLLDMNRFRCLFNLLREDYFPLSCWPYALERLCLSNRETSNFFAQQSSVIYNLLIRGLASQLGGRLTVVVPERHHSTNEPILIFLLQQVNHISHDAETTIELFLLLA